jgi:hypothetical protein
MKTFISTLFWGVLACSATNSTQAQTNWTQLGSDINGINTDELFAEEIAIAGNGLRIAISATAHDSSRGEVRVYEYDGNDWQLLGLPLRGASINQAFGNDIALSGNGNRLVVGNKYNNTAADSAGQVVIYDWNGNSWISTSSLNGTQAQELFGAAVDISSNGQRLIVGAPQYRLTTTAPDAPEGRALIYDWDNTLQDWSLSRIIASDEDGEYGGNTVDIAPDGESIAVNGGVCFDPNDPNRDGAKSFWLINNFWTWHQTITNTSASSLYGRSISTSNKDTSFAVGVPYQDGSIQEAGAVHVLMHIPNQPVFSLQSQGIATGDLHGYAVALSADGQRVLIGAPGYDNIINTNVGRCLIYDFTGIGWRQQDQIIGINANDQWGKAVAMAENGRFIAIASPNSLQNRGTVRVYHQPLVAVDELTTDNISFFPNPVNDMLQIRSSTIAENTTFQLFDAVGRLTLSQTLHSTNEQISLAALPTGIYFGQILTKNGIIFTQKIIKE